MGEEICTGSCPRILSVPRSEQLPESSQLPKKQSRETKQQTKQNTKQNTSTSWCPLALLSHQVSEFLFSKLKKNAPFRSLFARRCLWAVSGHYRLITSARLRTLLGHVSRFHQSRARGNIWWSYNCGYPPGAGTYSYFHMRLVMDPPSTISNLEFVDIFQWFRPKRKLLDINSELSFNFYSDNQTDDIALNRHQDIKKIKAFHETLVHFPSVRFSEF